MADILPTDSAAAAVVSDDAATQFPPQTPQRPTIVEISPEDVRKSSGFGTDPSPVITTIESQSVNNNAFDAQYDTSIGPGGPGFNGLYTGESDGRVVPGGTPGTPTNDDSGTKQITSQMINDAFAQPITAQPNVLDKYASYTYNLAWYIMAPDALENTKGKRSLDGCQLLMQSGGAPGTTGVPGARAPLFKYDYYIDNLELKSVIVGSATRMANNGTELQFTVTEPNGITLINNLVKTAQTVYGNNPKLPYQVADYLMVIRFYGYDQNGNLVRAGNKSSTQQNITVTTDTNAVIEKWFPFKLTNIKFKVSNRQIEYHVTGVIIPYYTGTGSNLGIIKSPVQMTGTTVKDILGGQATAANSVPPEDGRQSFELPSVPMAPQVNVGQGVLDAQAASGTVSTDFTNTQQPGLIGTNIPGVANSF